MFIVNASLASTNHNAAMVLVKSGNKVSNGVIVSSSGHAITTGHSLVRNKKVSVMVNGKWIAADTIFHSKRQDLALIKIRGNRDWPMVELGPNASIGQSVEVKTWRFDQDLYFVQKSGLYRKVTEVKMNSMNIYPTSKKLEAGQVFANVMVLGVHSRHGDSGGGVYNESGQLVGLISTTNRPGKNSMTIVQSLTDIKNVLEFENVGHYTADAEKLEWFLEGLTQAARDADIEEPLIRQLTKKVREKSLGRDLQKAMDFAFIEFYRVIKKNQYKQVSSRS